MRRGDAGEKGTPSRPRTWETAEGLLLHGREGRRRPYVPPGAARAEVLRQCHDDPLAVHFGFKRTLELLQRNYAWPHMAREVKAYVKACTTCGRIKPTRHKPYGLLESLPPATGPWTDITMDFITGLPPSKRWGHVYDAVLVVMDRYTKMARYIPTTKTIDAPTLAEVLAEQVFLRDGGVPQNIVSDRGTVFTAHFWSVLCYHLRIRHNKSTAFHPPTDGQTERQNQTLQTWGRCPVAIQKYQAHSRGRRRC